MLTSSWGSFGVQPHTYMVKTDAFLFCWGTHCCDFIVQVVWPAFESSMHIHFLEVRAIHFVVSFADLFCKKHVHVQTDNTMAKFYVNKLGGTGLLSLGREAVKIWNLATQNFILLGPTMLQWMCLAGLPSFITSSHYCPESTFFQSFIWAFPTVDLFATSHNAKVALFCAGGP